MLKEIACKTLTGRGRIDYLYERELRLDNISKTLGCWIINLNYEINYEKEDVYLDGFYSIQLWYAKDNDQSSSVYEEKINFHEKARMVYRNVSTISNEEAILIVDSKDNVKPEMTLDEELLLNVNPNYLTNND